MRVVLDTNILLTARMVRGSPPARLKDSEIGRMVNDLRRLAVMRNDLPRVSRSPDPADDYLLALCETARADYLVTGDKSHLLALKSHLGTRIVSARTLANKLRR